MIIPAGKNRLQVNQGGFKHESILNSELFKKFATLTGDPVVEDEAGVDPEIANAVGDTFSKGVDQMDRQQAGLDGVQPDAPAGDATADPGQQNIVQELDWSKIATEIDAWVKKISNGAFEVRGQTKGNKGEYTITFGPIGVMR